MDIDSKEWASGGDSNSKHEGNWKVNDSNVFVQIAGKRFTVEKFVLKRDKPEKESKL